MSRERFEELVGDALDEVPEELLGLMSNVVVLVEDDPPHGEPDLLGLYEGYALTSRGWDYAGVLPDRIIIYRHPILRICDTDEDVVDEVAMTVVHEIAHHFGIDDAPAARAGLGLSRARLAVRSRPWPMVALVAYRRCSDRDHFRRHRSCAASCSRPRTWRRSPRSPACGCRTPRC